MKYNSPSEKLLIEEVRQSSAKALAAARGLQIGTLIRTIRKQLGMSQEELARRAHVPQSTVSRIEASDRDATLSTLSKILKALSCDLVVVPHLHKPVDALRREQAKKKAKQRIHYLKGTMNLEDQEPDPGFVEELLKQEEERLLSGMNSALWEE